MSFREAAVLPVAYLTAYILLFDIGNIKAGQTLLFHSAGGGVGGKFTCSSSRWKSLIEQFFSSGSDTTIETGSQSNHHCHGESPQVWRASRPYSLPIRTRYWLHRRYQEVRAEGEEVIGHRFFFSILESLRKASISFLIAWAGMIVNGAWIFWNSTANTSCTAHLVYLAGMWKTSSVLQRAWRMYVTLSDRSLFWWHRLLCWFSGGKTTRSVAYVCFKIANQSTASIWFNYYYEDRTIPVVT